MCKLYPEFDSSEFHHIHLGYCCIFFQVAKTISLVISAPNLVASMLCFKAGKTEVGRRKRAGGKCVPDATVVIATGLTDQIRLVRCVLILWHKNRTTFVSFHNSCRLEHNCCGILRSPEWWTIVNYRALHSQGSTELMCGS